MKTNGKNKKRPTTIAYIALFALAGCAVVTSIILRLTGYNDVADIMVVYVTPAAFLLGIVAALIDTRLNPNLSGGDKSRITKGVLTSFGLGTCALFLLAALLPVTLFVIWILMLIAYGQAL